MIYQWINKFLVLFFLCICIQLQSQHVSLEKCEASFYSNYFEGRKTANGEIFEQQSLTAAHKQLPFGSIVKVTNLNNLKSVIVRINDRGPFYEDRCIDLTKMAAKQLQSIEEGVVPVLLECLYIPNFELEYKH